MALAYFGIKQMNVATDAIERHIEAIRLVGYTVVPSGWSEAEIQDLSVRLRQVYEQQTAESGGHAVLQVIDEANMARLPLVYDEAFLPVATHPDILAIARRMMGGYVVLNQQNATINMPGEKHAQSAFHRDLLYQHFTSSEPMALNAILCLDPFRADNGATWIVPGSQHWGPSASLASLRQLAVQVTAPAGSYIVMNSMNFHAAGFNASTAPRCGINNVYVRGFMRQQIDLPAALGGRYSDDKELAQLLGYSDRSPVSVVAWRQKFIDLSNAVKAEVEKAEAEKLNAGKS